MKKTRSSASAPSPNGWIGIALIAAAAVLIATRA
jgi:hypothetical protein